MPNCPKCHRPVNEGNSPNGAECHETDGEDGVCEAYAKVHQLREALEVLLVPYVEAKKSGLPSGVYVQRFRFENAEKVLQD